MNIRPAVAADLDDLVRLSKAHDKGAQSRAARVLGNEDFGVFVAEEAGVLVGIALVQFYGVRIRGEFGSARLHDIFVEEAHRNRGIATALLAAVHDWVIARPECKWLEWQASPSAIPFYEKMGLRANEHNDSEEYPFFEITVR
ncbi:GNAT family N-acetyltransferase [Psychromicrobium lacuslunae]|uniref:GNAT family N-acetyltransferase n=1 Tax=Psychromicrobium lacuslunae TaxID=1618207 RepID=UPI00069916E3|nr:GNAT family N-acetyltransferase [Psychromicrobium lacuslunae]